MSIVKNKDNITKAFYGHTPIYTFGNINSKQTIIIDGVKIAFSNFTTIPDYIVFSPDITDLSYMFTNCTSLTSIPIINTSNVTNMKYTFLNCHYLPTIPQLDTSKVTNMRGLFSQCYNLTSIPKIDTSKVTNMLDIFYGCSSLQTIPQLDTSNVTDMTYMFCNCQNLTSIPRLDVSNVNKMISTFQHCPNLTDIGGLINLKVSVEISYSGKLTRESVLNIFNDMAVVDNETIYFHKNVISKLTDEDIAIATQKGWLVVSD